MERLSAQEQDGSISFSVRVVPGASRDEVAGLENGVLKIRLRARAVEGQANESLLRFLAGCLGVRQRQVSLLRGHTARRKVVAVTGVTRAQVESLVG